MAGANTGLIGKDTIVPAGEQKTMPPEAEKKLAEIIARYPSKKSAIMPALYMAQEVYGYVSAEAVAWVADRVGVSPAHVEGVATFYTMYYKRPVGKYHVQVCRTLSCLLCGAANISTHLKKRFGVAPGEVTKDGMWSWEEVECLGSCGTAPMVEINDVFFENLTPEKLDAILDNIKNELPDLRYSAVREELGAGLPKHPRSQVWEKS